MAAVTVQIIGKYRLGYQSKVNKVMKKDFVKEKSIFTIERRTDFFKSCEGFLSDINTSVVSPSTGVTMKISEYLEYCIRYWPYRCGATSVSTYLEAIGVEMSSFDPPNDALLFLELQINLLHWAKEQNMRDLGLDAFNNMFGKNDVDYETDRLLQNAEYILEQCCNMQIREIEGDEEFPQYRICKRDYAVDAAIEAVPQLSDVLLGYLDIRNADSREYKEAALIAIYGYMEPKKNEYKGKICSSVSEEFFASMNAFGIRHKTKNQVKIHYTKRNKIYDKLFKMAIYILQTEAVDEYKAEMKALRSRK